MTEINLPVIYKSQWDSEASETRDDCGPACTSMTLDFYGLKTTINEVFKKTKAAKDVLITIAQMTTAISSYGYVSKFLTNQTIESLKSYLDRGIPVMALVHYGDFTSRQDKGFSGGHFFLVVGYRDDGFFVNDPDFYSPLRNDGDHHFYTKQDFINGWKNASKDGNPINSFLIIEKKDTPVIPDTQAEMDKIRLERDTNHNDRMALFEELGFTGVFNRTIAVEKIRQLLALEKQFVKKDEQLQTANSQIGALEVRIIELTEKNEELLSTQAKLNDKTASQQKTIEEQGMEIKNLSTDITELKNTIVEPVESWGANKLIVTGIKKWLGLI